MTKYETVVSEIKKEFPYVRIVEKKGWFWSALGWLVKVVTFGGNKTFNTNYITTLAHVIGVPVGWKKNDNSAAVLRHERVHLRQTRRCGLGLFWLGVLPYSLAYLLLPLPAGLAFFRYLFEREAYTESLRCVVESSSGRNWEAYDRAIYHYTDMLSGGAYGYTWPFRDSVRKYFEKQLKKITDA